MIKVSIKVDNLNLNAAVNDLSARMEINFRKAVRYLEKEIEQNILTSKQFDGKKLADNKPSTIKQKGENYPLVYTGGLLRGIRANYLDKFSAEIGFTDKADIYSKYLHGGTPKMEARPVIGVTSKLKKIIKDILING